MITSVQSMAYSQLLCALCDPVASPSPLLPIIGWPSRSGFSTCASAYQSIVLKLQQTGTNTKIYAPPRADGPQCYRPDVDHRPRSNGCSQRGIHPVCRTGTKRLNKNEKPGGNQVKTNGNKPKRTRTDRNGWGV